MYTGTFLGPKSLFYSSKYSMTKIPVWNDIPYFGSLGSHDLFWLFVCGNSKSVCEGMCGPFHSQEASVVELLSWGGGI